MPEIRQISRRQRGNFPNCRGVRAPRRLRRVAHHLLVTKLLLVAREIFNNHLVDTQSMLKELQREARSVVRK